MSPNQESIPEVNLGLAHIIGIDLNSAALIAPGSPQYEWLVRDLEAVDRNVTPWVFVTSHFPLYHATAVAPPHFPLMLLTLPSIDTPGPQPERFGGLLHGRGCRGLQCLRA